MKKINYLFYTISFLFYFNSFAMAVKTVEESNQFNTKNIKIQDSTQFFNAESGDVIIAKISNIEGNRISLKNDRISSFVNSDMKSFKIENNKKTGDIFLLPNIETGRPQNIFITSEKGHTYKLVLATEKTISQQIIINNIKNYNNKNTNLKNNYYSFVSSKIKEMAISPIKNNQIIHTKITEKIKVTLYEKKTFNDLVFLKGTIENISDEIIKLNKNSLPYKNRRAIWLESKNIGLSSSIYFVIVISRI